MSKLTAGDMVVAKTSSHEFTSGCEYAVERITRWRGLTMVKLYNDNGDPVQIEYPHDKDFGVFEKVD